MYLRVNDEDCWVVAPTEHELTALRQLEKYNRHMSGSLFPLSVLALATFMIVVFGLSQLIFGSILVGLLVVAPVTFFAWLQFFGLFRFGPRKTYQLMKRNGRIIPLRDSPVGIALCDHVIFNGDWEVPLMWQPIVLQRYSEADPSALDDYLTDPDNYRALSVLLAVDADSPAYDLYKVTLLRRAQSLIEAIRPFVEPTAAAERGVLAERWEQENRAKFERRRRQLAEARLFSLRPS